MGRTTQSGQEVGVVCKEADQFSLFTSRNSRRANPKIKINIQKDFI